MTTNLKAEKVVHDAMPNHISRIMVHKKSLLLEELMNKFGIHDVELVQGLRCGFRLSGIIGSSGLFDQREEVEPNHTKSELLKKGVHMRIQAEKVSSQPAEGDMQQDLEKATLDEVSRGWLEGLYTAVDLDLKFGHNSWVPARTFGIMQSAGETMKLRMIDDFSVNGQNDTASPSEKLTEGLLRLLPLPKRWSERSQ